MPKIEKKKATAKITKTQFEVTIAFIASVDDSDN